MLEMPRKLIEDYVDMYGDHIFEADKATTADLDGQDLVEAALAARRQQGAQVYEHLEFSNCCPS